MFVERTTTTPSTASFALLMCLTTNLTTNMLSIPITLKPVADRKEGLYLRDQSHRFLRLTLRWSWLLQTYEIVDSDNRIRTTRLNKRIILKLRLKSEKYYLLRYKAVQSVEIRPTFRDF